MKKFALIVALLVSVTAAFAQNPVGAWKGKVKIDAASMPKPQTPQQGEMMKKALAEFSKAVLDLNVKANKTYTIAFPSVMGQPSQSEEGKWSQKGNIITLSATKKQGKAVTGEKPQTLKISANGKKLDMVVPPGAPKGIQVSFTR